MSGNNICFVANYDLTYFYEKVAGGLGRDCAVYWVTVNRKLYDHLLKSNDKDNVLLINKEFVSRDSEKIGEFKLNELILGDRALRCQKGWPVEYLKNIQKPVYDFIRDNGIKIIMGEMTWAHEILMHRIVSNRPELGCVYLCPRTVRMPYNRFAFFKDEYENSILKMNGRDGDNGISIKVEKPDYLVLNDALLKRSRSIVERLKKIKRFITEENIDDLDPTLIPQRWIRFRLRAMEELNKETYGLVKTISFAGVRDRNYVFVALHKQPESSIDVLGRYYEDQFQNIVNIWRMLPDDWLLLVKEHTNAIGDRPPSFYRRLQKFRNIHFVDAKVDSYSLIERSQLVVTVSGTVAYEAGLMGRPAVTFAPVFFCGGCCGKIDLETLKNAASIHEIIESAKAGIDKESFALMLARDTFEGIISDPHSNPACMDNGNISKVADAILRVLNG